MRHCELISLSLVIKEKAGGKSYMGFILKIRQTHLAGSWLTSCLAHVINFIETRTRSRKIKLDVKTLRRSRSGKHHSW